MASLDYAFLCDSARLDAGHTLSALGIGFTHLMARSVPFAYTVSVAGTVWMSDEDEGTTDLTVTLVGVDDAYELTLENTLVVPPDELELAGKRAASFIAALTVAITGTGIYRVNLALDGTHVKSLAFEVVTSGDVQDSPDGES